MTVFLDLFRLRLHDCNILEDDIFQWKNIDGREYFVVQIF